MPFDALASTAVRQELENKIVGGRVQGLLMPGPLSLSLEIYKSGVGRAHLLISAHPQHAGIYLTDAAPSRDPEQHPPLLLLLRKYVRGGTVLNVSQPAYERVLALSIAKRFWADKHQEYHFEGDFRDSDVPEEEEDDAPIVTVDLIAEVMGRVSNIVLVAEDGAIIDSIKRVPPSINRYRTTLPHHAYVAPPPQEKRDPRHLNANTLSLVLARAVEEDPNAAAWKGLVSGVAALSPTLAREVTYRALGDLKAKAVDVARQPAQLNAILRELGAMFGLEQTMGWEPTIAWRVGEGGDRQALDFAPYKLTHLEAGGAELSSARSISQAADLYFGALRDYSGHSALKAQVRARLEEMRGREERRLFSLRDEWQRAQALDELRRRGEYLLAYAHTVTPGQTQLVVPEEGLTVALDPALTPVENAQAIFREYRKARSAQEGLPEKIADAEMRVGFYDELLTSLDLANTYDEIRAVQAESRIPDQPADTQPDSRQKGGKRKGKQQEKLPQPLRLQTKRGVPMLVGRTASQNDAATFRLALPDDLWFHARNIPGSHVILRAAGGITPEDIGEAASIAAGRSRARTDAQVDVVYTEKRYVRKVPNSPPGFVTYKNEQVVRVAPSRGRAKL